LLVSWSSSELDSDRMKAVAGFFAISLAASAHGAPYAYLSYAQIRSELRNMEEDFPGLFHLSTAQDEFGLGTSGTCGEGPCLNWIAQVTNFSALNEDTPEVFFSGELHGDERVGPTATVEFMRLLLGQYGSNPWITHLVDTRSIFVMPMANARGYRANLRTEAGVDVNRDFAFDTDPSDCMRSIAAQSLNELFRAHLFQLAITFHAGVEMITYVWGTFPTLLEDRSRSPDDHAQIMLGSTMSAWAGPGPASEGSKTYPHGRINDILYPVKGGMEDWAYAASWETRKHTVPQCTGDSNYPSTRTQYGIDELRVFNFLVETSNQKTPSESTLGTNENVLNPFGAGAGHIPRNIRLMLLLTDLVQPYIVVTEIRKTSNRKFEIGWEVCGSLFVHQTLVSYAFEKRNRVQTKKTKALRGKTRWSGGGVWKRNNMMNMAQNRGKDFRFKSAVVDRAAHPFITAFKTEIKLPRRANLREFIVEAKVDQAFKRQYKSQNPSNVGIQSHFTRARTENYVVEHNGHRIQGQKKWFSEKMCFDDKEQIKCSF